MEESLKNQSGQYQHIWLPYRKLLPSYYKTRSVTVCVCPATPLPFTDRRAPNLAEMSGSVTEKTWRDLFLWQRLTVAMATKKPSKRTCLAPILTNFCMWSLHDDISFPAKNEQNPPSGFGDRPIATAWQPESEWGPGGIAHVCDVTETSWRHAIVHMTSRRPYDVTDVIYPSRSVIS